MNITELEIMETIVNTIDSGAIYIILYFLLMTILGVISVYIYEKYDK